MSSLDTNPWSIFCDLHWKLICRNKWHPGTPEISTPLEVVVGCTSMHEHSTKTTPVFLPADEEAYWFLLPSSVSLLSGGTVQPQNTYPCILKVTGQVWESQKRVSINTNHRHHQCSNNKARFSFNQPNRKRWGAKLVNVKNIHHKAFLLWHHH